MIVRDAAGIAIDVPTTRRDAILNESLASHQSILRTTYCYSLISHQTGAQLIALSFQTIEFTNQHSEAAAVQIMNEHVPTFHAWRCQGSGIKTRTKEKKKKIG